MMEDDGTDNCHFTLHPNSTEECHEEECHTRALYKCVGKGMFKGCKEVFCQEHSKYSTSKRARTRALNHHVCCNKCEPRIKKLQLKYNIKFVAFMCVLFALVIVLPVSIALHKNFSRK